MTKIYILEGLMEKEKKNTTVTETDLSRCGRVRLFLFLFSGRSFLFPRVVCAARAGAAAHICGAAPKWKKGRKVEGRA
jgi:hypothetical protein